MALFTDGEPLDVSKLNDIASQLDSLKAQVAIMSSAYNAANKNKVPTIPVIETGSIRIDMDKAGTITRDIDFNASGAFNLSSEVPKIVASPRSELKEKQYVSISIMKVTTNPQIRVTSNDKLSNFLIDWIAIYQREVPAL
jgi:hypothetical protein